MTTAQARKSRAKPKSEKNAGAEKPREEALDLGALLDLGPKEMMAAIAALGPMAIPMFQEMYDGFMGDVRPLLKMAPELAGMVGKDAAPIIAAMMNGFNELVSADEMKTAIQAVQTTKASNRHLAMTAYETAGFSRDEAFALVLQDTASTYSTVSSLVKKVSDSKI